MTGVEAQASNSTVPLLCCRRGRRFQSEGHPAGRFMGAAHQPAIRQQVADLGEAADPVDLVEQDQSQDRSDPRHRAQQPKGHRIVHLGRLSEMPFQFGDLGVVVFDQGQVGGNAEPGAGIGEAVGKVRRAVAGIGELLGKGRQVELAVCRSWRCRPRPMPVMKPSRSIRPATWPTGSAFWTTRVWMPPTIGRSRRCGRRW